jgi:DNA-binding MarR family transcriptional regulator
MKAAFVRFLHLKDTLIGHQLDQEVDLVAQKLLEVIVQKDAQNRPITVTELMKLEHLASPATIHRKMGVLVKNGYVTLEYKDDNRRTKFLVPTQKSDDYFDQLGKLLIKSMA